MPRALRGELHFNTRFTGERGESGADRQREIVVGVLKRVSGFVRRDRHRGDAWHLVDGR